MEYNFRVIKSGDFIEVYTYQDTRFKTQQVYDLIDDDVDTSKEATDKKHILMDQMKNDNDEEFYEKRLDNVQRTKVKLKRFIYANVNQYKELDKFVTLTFRPSDIFENKEQPTRDEVIYCFKKFKMRFKYKYGFVFQHIAVMERGSEGTQRLHLHLVIFDMPYIPQSELCDLWSYGWVDVKQVNNTDSAVDYVLKYINKTLEGSWVGKGKKFYFASKGLYQPEVLYLDAEDFFKMEQGGDLGNLLFSFNYSNEFVGNCHYSKYRLLDKERDKLKTLVVSGKSQKQ